MDWLPEVNAWHAAAYTLYAVVLFLLFLVATFPYQALVERTVREVDLHPFQLKVSGTRFAWYKGIELQGVRLLRAEGGPEQAPILRAGSLYLRLAASDLFRGRISTLAASTEMYGGHVYARWLVDGRTRRIALQLDSLQIARYRPALALLDKGDVGGLLSGAVTVEGPNGNFRTGQAAGELQWNRARLSGAAINGFGLPDLRFAKIAAKFAVANGRLEIQSFRADGEELNLSGTGQIILRRPFAESVLHLRASIRPGPASPDAIRGLIALIPRPKNSRPDAPMAISGTLAHPRFR